MGETPGEGFPQTPFLRLMSNKNFARCGGRPGARPLDGARFFVKKRGKKLSILGFSILGEGEAPLDPALGGV